MKFKKFIFAFAATWMSAALAGPLDPLVSAAWVGESIPEQNTSTLQLNLTTVKAVNLLSISSPVANAVEIHSMKLHKGKLQMHIVNDLQLPEHRTITFGSDKLFLMMTGIKQPLNSGDKIPLRLTFSFADKHTKTIEATAEVRKMGLSYKHYGPNEVYDHH
jgi:copper(I)-binding protein